MSRLHSYRGIQADCGFVLSLDVLVHSWYLLTEEEKHAAWEEYFRINYPVFTQYAEQSTLLLKVRQLRGLLLCADHISGKYAHERCPFQISCHT